jgi:hypothetical protein
MALTIIVTFLGLWILTTAFKFYRRMKWEEPAIPTPDFGAMRKRESELHHMQDILREAHENGKLSSAFMQEYDHFLTQELSEIRRVTASSARPPVP